ncbi:MAG TPA: hypothetical protein VHO90_17460 [Bacteroidales bacterium]|nr:hypothetical protein [Bacteroidales bacterium]
MAKFFIILFVAFTASLNGQEFKVRIKQITKTEDGAFYFPKYSPDGSKLLLTSENYKGLKVLDLKTNKLSVITEEEGSGYEPVFTPDSKKVYYRSYAYDGMKKYSALSAHDLSSGEKMEVEKKRRNLSPAQIVNSQLVYSVDNIPQKSMLQGFAQVKSTQPDVYVTIENLKVVLYINGVAKPLSLNGDGNYIWASLSPDKQKIVYNFNGRVTCVADLDGNVLYTLGKLNAPKWLNNSWIVGMNDKDNGHEVVSSDIIVVSVDGKKSQNLTASENRIEMYPEVSADGGSLVYHTPKGEIFLMKLKNK